MIPSPWSLWYRPSRRHKWLLLGTRARIVELLDLMDWSGLRGGDWYFREGDTPPERAKENA